MTDSSPTKPKTRTPPSDVQQALRKEVHFGCPVKAGSKTCGKPILEFHHFDPPWSQEQHHRPEGMIALCPEHHSQADAGTWSSAQLRAFKQPVPTSVLRATFLWAEHAPLYCLGSSYAAKNLGGVLAVAGERVLWDERTEENRVLFSLVLADDKGAPVLVIDRNHLEVDVASVHDLKLTSGGTHLKVWHKPRNVGLELKFDRVLPASLPQAASDFAKAHCLDSDGKVPLVTIASARFQAHGRLVTITQGKVRSPGCSFNGCSAFGCSGFGFSL